MIAWRNPFKASDQNLAETPAEKQAESAARSQQDHRLRDVIMADHAAQSLADARRRGRAGHALSMREMGHPELAKGAESDEVGNIQSIGEQHVTHQYQQKSSAPVWVAALGAGLAVGAVSWLLSQDAQDQPTSPEPPARKLNLDVDVERGGAL